jgi:glutamine synthetase
MLALGDYLEARAAQLDEQREQLIADGVRFAHVQWATFPGTLRSKLAPAGKALSATPAGFNAALLATTHGDGNPAGDVLFDAPVSNMANGYPNILSLPDPGTLVRLPWRDATAAVLVNLFENDGRPCPLDLRALVRDVEDRAREMGYETRLAYEFELFLFEGDDDLVRAGRHAELVPYGRDLGIYDHLRHPGFEALARELMDRLAAIGITVAAFHTEYGRGMIEFALAPLGALAAADAATRAKLYLAELCEERGLLATFMARCRAPGTEGTSGAHLHQSLLSDGENAFADGDGGLSETGRHYLGGMLATLPEMHVVFRPTVNSYRRVNREEWSPVEASWGHDTRTCAIRAITVPAPSGVRFEHRVAGADVNPHLVVAACLGAGLHGIEHGIEPGAPSAGDPGSENGRHAELPATLPDSIAAFQASAFARDLLGPELHTHYADSRRAEEAAFQAWLAGHITAFEFVRYFEAH